jgi:hypothetical protein
MNEIFQALGSTFRTAKLGVGSIPYDSGNTKSIEIPASLLQRGLFLRLTGNLTIATANATIFSEAPLGLIKRIELVGDGRRYIFSASGRLLYRLAHFMWGKAAELSAPSGTVGTRAFSACIPLNHEALHFMDPSESLFDPRLFKKVELRITWGQASEIATAGGGGTIAIDTANTSCDVIANQTSEGVNKIIFDHTLSYDERNVAASSSAFTFDIPQNGLLAGVLFQATRDAGAGAGPVPVDDLIVDISLKSDTTVVHVDRVKLSTLQRENVLQYQLDGGATTGAQIPGYAYLPFVENGMFSSVLNVNALNKAQIILTVARTSGTENVQVLWDFFEPRRSLAAEVAAA